MVAINGLFYVWHKYSKLQTGYCNLSKKKRGLTNDNMLLSVYRKGVATSEI